MKPALPALLLGLAGCAAGMYGDLGEPAEACRAAAVRALRAEAIAATAASDGSLHGALADGRSVAVRFESLGAAGTRITVVVGDSDDGLNSAEAVRILERIAGALPP